jgi:hypothetical protein
MPDLDVGNLAHFVRGPSQLPVIALEAGECARVPGRANHRSHIRHFAEFGQKTKGFRQMR